VQVQVDAPRLAPHAARTLGAWTLDITYDSNAVKVLSCEAAAGGICNAGYAPGVVRIVGASASGLRGKQTLATLTLEGVGGTQKRPLSVRAVTLADSDGADLSP